MPQVTLVTGIQALDRLHELADKRGKPKADDRSLLFGLLVDHAALCRTCKEHGIKVIEPSPSRGPRARLRSPLGRGPPKPLKSL